MHVAKSDSDGMSKHPHTNAAVAHLTMQRADEPGSTLDSRT